MKKIISIITAMTLAFTLAACSQNTEDAVQEQITPAQVQTTEPQTAEPQISEPQTVEPQDIPTQKILTTIHAASLENNMIEEDTEQGIGILLPKNYESSDRQYPVLYFLPGFGDTHEFYLNMFNMVYSENEDMIIVIVNGRNKLQGSFYVNSPVTGNWEDFVTKDVISYIDTNYRTISDSSGRGLAGHSMGGFGVINIVMHNPGLFDYAYSMSPGVFDENGLEKSPMSFNTIKSLIEDYSDMSEQEALEDYVETLRRNSFSTAYGSAFAYDENGKAPFIKIPQSDGNGGFVKDEVWEQYNAGYGSMAKKLELYGDNLKNLKSFAIEYGTSDEYVWIREGSEYFSKLMTEKDISHKLITFDGNHQGVVGLRLKDAVIPFFTDAFYSA